MTPETATPTTAGADVERQMAEMRAFIVERYQLTTVPGRPEEHVGSRGYGVSLGYGCKTIRVRAMIYREWIDELTADFPIGPLWPTRLTRILDPYFNQTDLLNPLALR